MASPFFGRRTDLMARIPPTAKPRSAGAASAMGAQQKTTPAPVEIVLSAKAATWRMNDAEHDGADAAFQAKRGMILINHNHMCRGIDCGFYSKKWQEVHHIDDNHHNNDDANLVTLCGFCHACFHIGRAAQDGAVLIWIPEVADQISQGELNRIVRTLYVGVASNADVSEPCRMLLGALQQHSVRMVERIGFNDPAILANVLMRMTPQIYAKRAELLWGVRLLCAPHKIIGTRDRWYDMMAYWTGKVEGPYGSIPPSTWPNIFKRMNHLLQRDAVNA